MAKGYWIARVDVHDAENYKGYLEANAAPLRKYGAKFLVRGGKFHCPEGGHRARNVVIEFPSYDAALACYRSPEYQHAKSLRLGKADVDLVVIEAFAGH